MVLTVTPPLAADETIQRYQQDTAIPGAREVQLTLGNLTAGDSDLYHARIETDGNTIRTQACLVVVVPGFRLVDQSARANVSDHEPLIVGFVIGRSSESARPKTFLIRVLGSSLARIGIENGVAAAKVSLFRRGTPCDRLLQEDSSLAVACAAKVGAFALNQDSTEFVRVADLPAGHYPLHASASSGIAGNVLVEIYETDVKG